MAKPVYPSMTALLRIKISKGLGETQVILASEEFRAALEPSGIELDVSGMGTRYDGQCELLTHPWFQGFFYILPKV